MALVLKNGAVFLHVPKTGGRWVTRILFELGLVRKKVAPKHADIDHFFFKSFKQGQPWLHRSLGSLLGRGSQKPFMFCFVRHPLSWYESWFKYMSQPAVHWKYWGDASSPWKWHPNAVLNGLGSSDFNQFVRNVVQARPGYVTELFGWYTKPSMDFIGKQEHLVEDLIRVLKRMDLSVDEDGLRRHAPVGVSPEPEQRITWAGDLRQKVMDLEYAGLVRYGYLAGQDRDDHQTAAFDSNERGPAGP